MSSDRTLRHNALVYESQDEYLARAVPFLKAGIEAGEGAVVAHTKPGLAMMREALGPEAALVTFVDVSGAYTRPARTLAAYHKVYIEQLRKSPTLRAVADVQFGPDPNEWDLWTGYEAVFNRSFGHLPAWVLCSYDANGTPDPVIESVWQTHPEVVADDSWIRSDHYEDPDHLLRRLTPSPAALTDLRPIPFGRSAEELRERLARELAAGEIGEPQSLDLLLAATEVANNAMQHGGGIQEVVSDTPEDDSSARSSTGASASTTPQPATSPLARESVRASGSPGSWPGASSSSTCRADSPPVSGSECGLPRRFHATRWVSRHAPRQAAGDADEDTLVQPVEPRRRSLDLGGGAEGVFARVDVLAAGETCENPRAAVADAPRLDVERRHRRSGACSGCHRARCRPGGRSASRRWRPAAALHSAPAR